MSNTFRIRFNGHEKNVGNSIPVNHLKEVCQMADNNMSYEEAGKKGGEQTAENHSKEFYQDIGEKGGDHANGKATKAEAGQKGGMHASGKMTNEEAGQKGGEQTAENHDKEFYQDIGEKGGDNANQ